MDMLSDRLKINGVKIKCSVGGVLGFSSGVVYVTPNICSYDYVLTAKHTFQEDNETEFKIDKVVFVEIFYQENGEFKQLEYIKSKDLKNKIIDFNDDVAIIVINKNPKVNFRTILVSNVIESSKENLFSWSISKANQEQLQKYDYVRNDTEMKRFKLDGNHKPENLPGLSGAGMFSSAKSILYGVINKYPNKDFHNSTIDCALISFSEINAKLKLLNRIELDLKSSNHKRIIGEEVVDIHQVTINGVCLDLELARKRLETDIRDDWFYDPLGYIDLLNQDYLFKQFESYFGKKKYKSSIAEQFFVPKKTFTLRQALVSPFIDRIMYFAVVGVLADKIDAAMIPQVYSARYNRYRDNNLIINGVEQWEKMKYQLADCAERYNCVIEIDLLNYYDNISKQLLNEKILRICDTPNERNAAKLLNEILLNLSKKEVGLPQNSDASSLLATFYLNQIDVFMQHHAPDYYRFMDDIRIFCNDRYEARKLLQTLETELRRCHLSVNSQKTKIIEFNSSEEGIIKKDEYTKNLFDIELNKISRHRNSNNYAYKNQAFHSSIELLEKSILEDVNSSNDSSRKLNYALNTIALLGHKGVWFYSQIGFKESIKKAINLLFENPWITRQICNVLNLMSKDQIENEDWEAIVKVVLEEKFNTYSLQTYQIWMLLARHKYKTKELVQFAVKTIEKNDETMRPVIAAMVIYLSSVDDKFRRVILRKYGEDFTHGYFQDRLTLISLRSFPTDLISKKHTNASLIFAHEFLYKFKDKDLVYIQGAIDEKEEENDFEQLYSI